MARFFKSMIEFNTIEPIGSIYEQSFNKKPKFGGKASKLVGFVVYCLNPNHFHFVIRQIADRGIEKFMHRLGCGFTRYMNDKHKRGGSLFQGKFKAVHISSDSQLLHTSAYVNLNDKVHSLGGKASKSSFCEYVGVENGMQICDKDIILHRFKNSKEYKEYAEGAVEETIKRRKEDGKVDENLLE